MSAAAVDFHSQIASIMEVLANAAVAEICKVVDDGYAVVHLEMTRSQKESEFLRRKIKLLELQVARYRAERVKAAEGSVRAERVKAAEGSVRVRLLSSRQSRDSAAGSSLHCRTRFLNRGPAAQQTVQKTPPINLYQDPDQEVVTTTKTESAEPEKQQQEEEEELLIVKVEEATEAATTHQEVSSNPCIHRGDIDPPTSLSTTSKDGGRQLSETEPRRHPTHPSSPLSEREETQEVTGDSPEKKSPAQSLLEWRESRQSGGSEPASCSSYTAVSAAASSFSLTGKERSIPEPDVIVIDSGQGGCGGPIPEACRSDGVEGVSRSQTPPLLCLSSGESTWATSAYTTSPVTEDIVNVSQQNSWSGGQQMVYQTPSTQNQKSLSQEPSFPFTCSICSRQFSHHCKLRIHERAHTGEKPYKCPHCEKRFGQMSSLKRHQMVHTGERPFPCPHCGKTFATSTNLKVHQSVHTGERRFHCSKCGKNFSFLSNLIRHQALHRNK